jgi:16S rRNA (guanine527-N7)-methyltransferase
MGDHTPVGPAASEPPAVLVPAARSLFGARLPLAIEYADRLVTDGVVRGLIGPHEAPRIWQRHLLNCAAIAELIAPGSAVVDVGSGAGLPGVVLAVARPDLAIVLIEPLARRTTFLSDVVTALGLDQTVSVVRARAEECAASPAVPAADVVTARALAPLSRLIEWCLPLAAIGGRVLAMKGESAEEEVEQHRDVIRRLGGSAPIVRRCGAAVLEQPTTVVEVERIGDPPARSRDANQSRARRPRSRRA